MLAWRVESVESIIRALQVVVILHMVDSHGNMISARMAAERACRCAKRLIGKWLANARSMHGGSLPGTFPQIRETRIAPLHSTPSEWTRPPTADQDSLLDLVSPGRHARPANNSQTTSVHFASRAARVSEISDPHGTVNTTWFATPACHCLIAVLRLMTRTHPLHHARIQCFYSGRGTNGCHQCPSY